MHEPADTDGSCHCPHRRSVRRRGGKEDAVCGLLVQLTGLRDESACRVGRDACEACLAGESAGWSAASNPVLASRLFRIAHDVKERGGAPGLSAARADRLARQAEHHLSFCRVDPSPSNWSCDVVVCCADSSPQAERAVLSVLEQDGAIPIVHLVDDGGGGAALVGRFAGRWNVVAHANDREKGLFPTLHALLPRLRSEFVAVQDTATVSHRDRLATSVGLLVARGGEILMAPVATPGGTFRPEAPGRAYRRTAPAAGLAFRRASLIDMGGIAPDRAGDADAELLFRAAREHRHIVQAPEALVSASGPLAPGPLGRAPRLENREGSFRHHAIGFPTEPVVCDVVLPFRGHVRYLRQAIASMLEQEGAEAIVHLIDDATPGGADDELGRWASHPRVRTYRNLRNIGQFHSFNNVIPYLETRLVAVQDADDISRPDRLHASGNLLRLADAEIFGGWSRMFRARPDPKRLRATRQPPGFGISTVPKPGVGFFVENPTAMLRVAAFESLRGFGDYGDLDCNKCGLDTEFYARAYYAGTRFAISRRVVVDYRLHHASAVRNGRTGWGTPARLRSETENNRRFHLFQQGPFDARVFGAMGRTDGLTERLPRRRPLRRR